MIFTCLFWWNTNCLCFWKCPEELSRERTEI